jgi:hypothetical protein
MQWSSRRLLAIAAVGGALGTGGVAATAAASSAAAPTHGMLQVWVTPGKGAVDQILLTGVIADHGTATTVNGAGTPDRNGTTVKVALSKGSFEVNTTAFSHALAKLQPKLDRANCSAWGTGSGDVTLGDGGGAYTGISGTIRMTTSFAAILPRFTSGAKKGQCDPNAKPIAQFSNTLDGHGHITL